MSATKGKRRIDRILDPSYLDGVQSKPLSDLRAMRVEASEEEALVSYERRMLHGRLAILRAELERRAGHSTATLTEMLPQILADEARGPGRGALPTLDPNLDFQHPHRRVTQLVSDDTLANLPTMSEEEIRDILTQLEEVEREVSEVRRPLLAVLDALNAEVARRYQTGEATAADAISHDA